MRLVTRHWLRKEWVGELVLVDERPPREGRIEPIYNLDD